MEREYFRFRILTYPGSERYSIRMRTIQIALVGLLVFLWFPYRAFADSFYPNSGIDVTDEADTVSAGHSELFFESDYNQERNNSTSGNLSAGFKCGLSNSLDVGIQLPYSLLLDSRAGNASGFNDIQFGLKYKLNSANLNHIQVATAVGVKPPSASLDNNLGNGVFDLSGQIDVSYYTKQFKHHLNYGYNWLEPVAGTPRRNHSFYKYKLDYEPSEESRWSYATEIFGEQNEDPTASTDPLSIKVITQLRSNENLTFNFGVSFGLTNADPTRRYLFGVIFDH